MMEILILSGERVCIINLNTFYLSTDYLLMHFLFFSFRQRQLELIMGPDELNPRTAYIYHQMWRSLDLISCHPSRCMWPVLGKFFSFFLSFLLLNYIGHCSLFKKRKKINYIGHGKLRQDKHGVLISGVLKHYPSFCLLLSCNSQKCLKYLNF